MPATSASRDRLKTLLEELQQLSDKEALDWENILSKAELLLLHSSVQHFQSQRKARLVELEQELEKQLYRDEDAIREASERIEGLLAAPPNIPFTTEKNTQNLGDEVKVLPHPEGPPLHRNKEINEGLYAVVSDERSKSSPKEQAQKAEGKSEKSEKPKEESQTPWKLGLNDRIALSQHLFGGNAQDLQRVLSQVGTMENYEQARQFIVDIVRADYDWSEAGEYVERLLELVEAYFLHRK